MQPPTLLASLLASRSRGAGAALGAALPSSPYGGSAAALGPGPGPGPGVARTTVAPAPAALRGAGGVWRTRTMMAVTVCGGPVVLAPAVFVFPSLLLPSLSLPLRIVSAQRLQA